MTTKHEIALRIFCAMLQQGRVNVTLLDSARQDIETAFALAETFIAVAAARANTTAPPEAPAAAAPE